MYTNTYMNNLAQRNQNSHKHNNIGLLMCVCIVRGYACMYLHEHINEYFFQRNQDPHEHQARKYRATQGNRYI